MDTIRPLRFELAGEECRKCGGKLTVTTEVEQVCCGCGGKPGIEPCSDFGHCEHKWHCGDGDPVICENCGPVATIYADESVSVDWPDEAENEEAADV